MKLKMVESLVVFLISSSAWGQTTILGTTIIVTDEIVSDTFNNAQHKEFENRIDLKPINLSDSNFEIRFYTSNAATNNKNLRIVRFANGQWEAFEFEERSRSLKRHVLAPLLGYDAFVKKLIDQKILTLPNQSEVHKRIEDSFSSKKEALESRPSIMDGYEFTVEFKIGDKFRVYQFTNPNSYAKYYVKVEEFKNYVSVQKIFEKDLIEND